MSILMKSHKWTCVEPERKTFDSNNITHYRIESYVTYSVYCFAGGASEVGSWKICPSLILWSTCCDVSSRLMSPYFLFDLLFFCTYQGVWEGGGGLRTRQTWEYSVY
jgi:hypothetical protein